MLYCIISYYCPIILLLRCDYIIIIRLLLCHYFCYIISHYFLLHSVLRVVFDYMTPRCCEVLVFPAVFFLKSTLRAFSEGMSRVFEADFDPLEAYTAEPEAELEPPYPSGAAVAAEPQGGASAPGSGNQGDGVRPTQSACRAECPAGGVEVLCGEAFRGGPARFYSVWAVPGALWCGVLVSLEPRAWNKVAAVLPHGRYIGSGARLRRADTLDEAIALFRAEPGYRSQWPRIWVLP